MNRPNTRMSANREKETLDLLTCTSLLRQLCFQPDGQEQLGKELDNDLPERGRYRVLASEVNLQSA